MVILRSRRLPLAGLAIASLLIIGPTAGQAADPFVAGGRSTQARPAPADALARARDRGRALSVALGLPGTSARVQRLDDRFEHRTYDEVTNVDSAGRDVAVARFDLDGRPTMAVALGWRAKGGRALDAPGAGRRAAALAGAAGLTVQGSPTTRSIAAGGWSVAWPRLVDGVPVPGDGLRLSLWPDGTFHGMTRSERPLASRPAVVLGAGGARAAAERFAALHLADPANLRVTAVRQAWVAANDTFAPAAADAPDATLRLAWIVTFEATGPLADRLHAVALDVDAGDGSILGGDVAE